MPHLTNGFEKSSERFRTGIVMSRTIPNYLELLNFELFRAIVDFRSPPNGLERFKRPSFLGHAKGSLKTMLEIKTSKYVIAWSSYHRFWSFKSWRWKWTGSAMILNCQSQRHSCNLSFVSWVKNNCCKVAKLQMSGQCCDDAVNWHANAAK